MISTASTGSGAQALARDPRVLDRHEVGVRAVGALRGQLQHPRAQRREHDRRAVGRRGPVQAAASIASR